MTKKKLATVWLGGCSGCHMSLLDIDERILEVAALADIVKSPLVDGKEFPQVDIALVEGAVSLEEHLEEIQRIRERSKYLVALGDCAVTANVAGLRNLFPRQAVLDKAYKEAPSNDHQGEAPSQYISPMLDRVRPLHEVVRVDVFLPGCPPTADTIFCVLINLLHDKMPDLQSGEVKYG